MNRIRAMSLVATLASTVIWGSLGLAQDPGATKDDALDGLLEKLEGSTSPDGKAPAQGEKASSEKKGTEKGVSKKGTEKGASKGSATDSSKEKGSEAKGDIAPKDQELDNFLEKLGQTRETPATDDRPKGGGPGPDSPPPPEPGKGASEKLKGNENDLDQHLEELTGRRRKRSNEQEGSGPLSQVIKEMRDVEERLGKTDTSEETRKKQEQIVKKLDTLIEQLRNSSGQSRGRRKYLVMERGKQGNRPGDQQGANGGHAPPSRPQKPNAPRSRANSKDEWGHLPADIRQELMNIDKEEPLAVREELIRRYFLSLDKKYLIRGE